MNNPTQRTAEVRQLEKLRKMYQKELKERLWIEEDNKINTDKTITDKYPIETKAHNKKMDKLSKSRIAELRKSIKETQTKISNFKQIPLKKQAGKLIFKQNPYDNGGVLGFVDKKETYEIYLKQGFYKIYHYDSDNVVGSGSKTVKEAMKIAQEHFAKKSETKPEKKTTLKQTVMKKQATKAKLSPKLLVEVQKLKQVQAYNEKIAQSSTALSLIERAIKKLPSKIERDVATSVLLKGMSIEQTANTYGASWKITWEFWIKTQKHFLENMAEAFKKIK